MGSEMQRCIPSHESSQFPYGVDVEELVHGMFRDVNVEVLYICRDSKNYPNGCHVTLRSVKDYNMQIRVSIVGQSFKDLQTLILATIGFEDADEIT